MTTGLVLLTLAAALSAAAQQAGARLPYRLSFPGEDWALDIDLSAFNIPPANEGPADAKPSKGLLFLSANPTESYSEDGTEYQLSAFQMPGDKSRKSLTRLRITFGPARAGGSAADFRDYVLRNLPKRALIKDWSSKGTEYKGIPLVRFRAFNEMSMATPGGGPPIPMFNYGQRTLAAYFVRGDTWVTVSLEAQDIGEREEKLLYSLLDSVRFVDTSAPSTSFDYYHKGRVLYLARDYGKAAEFLTTALRLEHKERRLDTASWRGMIGNLIDSLAGSGNVPRAKEALDYAVARDPTYPLFQLALARYHASLGDLDNALAHLEKAYQNTEHGGAAAKLPDPSWDPAFERFRKDERFRKAVKALKK